MGETLGQGSFGKVTTARDTEENRGSDAADARSGERSRRTMPVAHGCSSDVVPTGEIGTSCKNEREGQWKRRLGTTLGANDASLVSRSCAHTPPIATSSLPVARCAFKVAIKIVDKSGIANVEDVERVYRETFILTTLKHVNIIKLFEVLDTPKSIMLVMEYAGGGELFSYVAAKHRLGEVESCRLFQQIISGVECKHKQRTQRGRRGRFSTDPHSSLLRRLPSLCL